MLLLLGAIDTIVLFFHLSVMVFVVSAVLLVVLVWPIDALTVRLVQPGKWRGCWRGYET